MNKMYICRLGEFRGGEYIFFIEGFIGLKHYMLKLYLSHIFHN